jgi:hypothetical protein
MLRNRCLCPDYFSPSLRGQRNRAPRSGALGPGDVAGNPPAATNQCAATNRSVLANPVAVVSSRAVRVRVAQAAQPQLAGCVLAARLAAALPTELAQPPKWSGRR